MSRFCLYCGARLMGAGPNCEHCNRRLVRPPCQNDGDVTDDEALNEEVEAAEMEFTGRSDILGEESITPEQIELNLISPPDHQEMMYGYIERFRGDHVHTYHFCREADGAFILAASMSATKEGPVFFHTCDNLNMKKTSLVEVPKRRGQAGFVACLFPTNLLGTEFVITTREETTWTTKLLKAIAARTTAIRDGEIDPIQGKIAPGNNVNEVDDIPSKSKQEDRYAPSISGEGRELGLFMFGSNILGSQPNTVQASVRANPLSERASDSIKEKVAKKNMTRAGADQTLFERLRGKRDRSYRPLGQDEDDDDEIVTFETKKPQWSEAIKGWTLDFNGRVTISSKKNFILVPNEMDEILFGAETIGVRFGKVSKHRFNLDYRFPFSPLAAMAVAVSMFSSKLTVTW